MMALLWIKNNWKVCGIAVFCFVLGYFIWESGARGQAIASLKITVSNISAQKAMAEQTANSNALMAMAIKKQGDDALSAMARTNEAARTRTQNALERQREILNVKKSEDGLLAPVLLHTLSRLRGTGAGAGH
jgi:hypothetical protein